MLNPKLRSKIKKEFAKPGSYVVLTLLNTELYGAFEILFLDFFSKEMSLPGVYVTVNKPALTIIENCKKENIDHETIIFIDGVSKISETNIVRKNKILYLDNPENLTDLGISVNEAITSLPKNEKFILFDSINTLLVYNDEESVIRFAHFLISRMREWDVKGIIFTLEKSMKTSVFGQISQFCDNVVDTTKW